MKDAVCCDEDSKPQASNDDSSFLNTGSDILKQFQEET